MRVFDAEPAAADLLLRSRRVVTPTGTRAASVAVAGGRIAAVSPYHAAVPRGARVRDFGGDVLLPGLVDTHVHINDPGRAHWEGFATATRAAAAGGITTLIDMPLNSLPPTTSVAHLRAKQAVASGSVHVDVGFWGGAVPGNAGRLRELHDAGVFGFKCFLSPSGVDEFPPLDRTQAVAAMAEVAGFRGLLIVHAEDPRRLAGAPRPAGPRYADFLRSRPAASEDTAIEGLIAAARTLAVPGAGPGSGPGPGPGLPAMRVQGHGGVEGHGGVQSGGGVQGRAGVLARVHVLHLSSSGALPLIAAARRDGLRITAETCPHYLTLGAQDVPDGASAFKCCPPIREGANREPLWAALADGTLDCVVTDHSPCTADLKTTDFATAWGGISSLQLSLSVVWTEAARRGHTLQDIARWMSARPAELVGLGSKGAIEAGRDADFAVFAPDETFTVDPAALQHRNPVTAYAGKPLRGIVTSTWLRGACVYDRARRHEETERDDAGGVAGVTNRPGTPVAAFSAPTGRLLERTD